MCPDTDGNCAVLDEVAFLASDGACFVNGQIIDVDGGAIMKV